MLYLKQTNLTVLAPPTPVVSQTGAAGARRWVGLFASDDEVRGKGIARMRAGVCRWLEAVGGLQLSAGTYICAGQWLEEMCD